MPAAIDAWRAGFWPCAAVSTAENDLGHVLALDARLFQCGGDRHPAQLMRGRSGKGAQKLPTGVRLAAVMTISVMKAPLGSRLSRCWEGGDPVGERLPELLLCTAADDHADMARAPARRSGRPMAVAAGTMRSAVATNSMLGASHCDGVTICPPTRHRPLAGAILGDQLLEQFEAEGMGQGAP